jgi:hypothetical protein
MRLPLGNVLRVLALGGLAALSLPGVQAARADTDLVPPVAQLFSWDAASAPPAQAGPASCAANQLAVTQQADLRRREAMARIAAVVKAEPGGSAEPLNGRGYAYPVQRDPNAELRQVVQEAQRQRALRAAGSP